MSLVEARARRARLINPPNAVPDRPIDLRPLWQRPEVVEIAKPVPAPRIVPAQIIPVTKRGAHESEIGFVERQILYFQGRLNAAKEQHAKLAGYQPARRVPIRAVQKAVCLFYQTDLNEMLGPYRASEIVHVRHVAMYLAKIITCRSYPEIGRAFGGRDHSTAVHAIHKIEAQIAIDPELKARIEEIKDLFVASVTNTEDGPCSSMP